MSLDFLQVFALLTVGLLAGALGGMLGIGGSVIMIPGMRLIVPGRDGQPLQHLYQAAAMIVNVFVAAPSALRHYRMKAAVPPILHWLIPSAVCGVVGGVMLSNHQIFRGAQQANLSKVFAVFLAYTTCYNVYEMARKKLAGAAMPDLVPAVKPAAVTIVGLIMGLSAGLTGIGGGALAVPMQQIFLRVPLRNAIANSACTIVFSALVGSALKNATLAIHHSDIQNSLIIAAALIPSAIVGAWVGAKLTHTLPKRPVQIIFIATLLASIWTMWTKASPAPVQSNQGPTATQPAESQPAMDVSLQRAPLRPFGTPGRG